MAPVQNGFVRQVKLSGKEKAAVLLGELGFAAENLTHYFSDSELKKIRKGRTRMRRHASTKIRKRQERGECAQQDALSLMA